LSVIAATGLALAGQIHMRAEQLRDAYEKLGLDPNFSDESYVRNQNFLNAAESLGRSIWKCSAI
jgi:hypothetical protein